MFLLTGENVRKGKRVSGVRKRDGGRNTSGSRKKKSSDGVVNGWSTRPSPEECTKGKKKTTLGRTLDYSCRPTAEGESKKGEPHKKKRAA